MPRSVEAGMRADPILVFALGSVELPTLIRRWLESWPAVSVDTDPSLLAARETSPGTSNLGASRWNEVATAPARVNLHLMHYPLELSPEPNARHHLAA